jgi:hypothetical protein
MDREMLETPFLQYDEAPHGGISILENDYTEPEAKKSLWRVYSFVAAATDSLTHTFLVSIFEGVFFWMYISKLEKDTMKIELKQSETVVQYACMGLNSIAIPVLDHSIEVYKGMSGPHMQDDEVMATVILSIVLFFMSIGGTLACTLVRVKTSVPAVIVKTPDFSHDNRFNCRVVSKELMRTLNSAALSIVMIGIYEAVFFQLVVYKYRPLSTEKVMVQMLKACKAGELKHPG